MKLSTLAISASFAGSLFAQNDLPQDAIPVPDPADQMATFILDENLEINLFAADPMIAKPVAMNWDAEGRLWVVSSRLYPHIKPGERSNDQVVVLEDADGDGAADKSTVFADDLLIPTGIMPGDGGAYVANSTEILFLKDTDGDLKEDQRTVSLSGFGTEDTHHIIHAFRGGPDGMLYFNQSIYIHSHIETPHGLRRLMAGGIWHFRPETMELEVFARGFVNSWGHAFDRYGQSFATDGAFGEGINYVFPGSMFKTAYNAKRELRGLNPGQPKQCGLEIVDSSHFPDDWRGSMVTNDFRGHRVNRFVVTESGSGYVSRQAPDLVRTTHGAFRPIDVKVGPDGALYIADWYNPIIQHGEVDFRDPRRDHTHGRIWRVTYKGRPLAKKPEVVGKPVPQIVAQLRSDEGLTRHFAKRQLQLEDKTEVLAELEKMESVPDLREVDRLEILWANQSVNHFREPLLRALLQSKDHRVRAAAVRVLYHWHGRMKGSEFWLGRAAIDEHPQVRLEAINALRQIGGVKAFESVSHAIARPLDVNLDYAAWLTAREMEADWLPAFQRGELLKTDNAKVLEFVLGAIENPGAIKPLVDSVRDGKVTIGNGADSSFKFELISKLGTAADLGVLFDTVLKQGANRPENELEMLWRAARDRKIVPAGDLNRVKELFESESEALQAEAIRAAGHWKVPGTREIAIAHLAENVRPRLQLQEASIDALAALGGGQSVDALSKAVAQTGYSLGCWALVRMAELDTSRAAKETVTFLKEPFHGPLPGSQSGGGSMADIIRAFLGRKDGAQVLAKALDGRSINSADARTAIGIAESSGGKIGGLVAALTKAGGLDPIAKLTAEEKVQLVAQISAKGGGDAARGEQIYRRQQLLCATCHAIGGAGGVIGPDLISIGASAPVDYIIDSLLEPAAKIKEGYHTTVITTKDNQIITGSVVSDADGEVTLRMVDGSHKTVMAAQIAKREVVPVSLMPPGLTASLRKDEFVDLVLFLSQLGKEGAYKLPAGRHVRRWRVLPYDNEVSSQIRRAGTQAMLDADTPRPWRAAYSTVSGGLPLGEIGINKGFSNQLSFAKFEIDVSAAGEIGFRIENPQGLQILSGGAMVAAQSDTKATLATGRHEIVVMIDRVARSSGDLRVELVDVEGSEGRATLVGGL